MRSDPAPLPFLTGGGELAQLIGSMDWGRTEVGPIDQWPAHTKSATSLMLRSVVPMVMLWGRDGVMVYNNAYAAFAGDRHPRLLGCNVREGWDEACQVGQVVRPRLSTRSSEATYYLSRSCRI